MDCVPLYGPPDSALPSHQGGLSEETACSPRRHQAPALPAPGLGLQPPDGEVNSDLGEPRCSVSGSSLEGKGRHHGSCPQPPCPPHARDPGHLRQDPGGCTSWRWRLQTQREIALLSFQWLQGR